jgi:PAS domain S-box-containing protein
MTDLDSTVTRILLGVIRSQGYGSATLALANERSGALEVRIAVGNTGRPLLERVESILGFQVQHFELPLRQRDSLLVRAYELGESHVTTDVYALGGGFLSRELADALNRELHSQYAVVPVNGRRLRLGALLVEKPRVSAFSKEDLERARDYANHIGLAIENERLSSESREYLDKIFASVRDAIVTVTRDLRICACNDAVERVLGYRPHELIGRPVSVLFPDRRAYLRAARHVLSALRRRGYLDEELLLRRQDGAHFPARVSALLLADEEGRPAGAVGTVRDVSEEKRNEAERLRLQEELVRRERLSALGEMAAKIAHEIRNPLVSIASVLQVMADDVGERSPLYHDLGRIRRELDRLDAIVTDFLEFARPRPLRRRSVDLASLVREAMRLAATRLSERGVRVRLELDGAPPAWADEAALVQVLWNLLRNAADAVRPGGEVVICARAEDGGVELSVRDDGVGIAPEVRERAFEPFFSTKPRGTGLGLAICRKIVEDHGGRIAMSSAEGEGTRVRVWLPPAVPVDGGPPR